MAKKLEEKDVTFEMVKPSVYGCRNCLWNSCECSNGSKFKPMVVDDTVPGCHSYTYYD